MPPQILGPAIGPPMGYPGFPGPFPLAQGMPYGPPVRHSFHVKDIDIATAHRTIRLRRHTIQKYLPGLWQIILDRNRGHGAPNGRAFINARQLPGLMDVDVQEGLAQVLKHLRDLERTDGSSSSLFDWLESVYQRSRRTPSHARYTGFGLLTTYFLGLGLALDRHHLAGHRKLFQIISHFLVKNCKELVRDMKMREFLCLIRALDRTGHDMNETLAAIVSAIGTTGRHRLRQHIRSSDSLYNDLSRDTRRNLRKILEAKRHGQDERRLVPFRPRLHARDMVRYPSPGAHLPLRDKVGVIPRNQVRELRHRLGPNVRFQNWAPNNHVFYRIVDSGPGAAGHVARRRRLHARRPLRIGNPEHAMAPVDLDLSTSDDDFYDDDDLSTIATSLLDDDDDGLDYELGPGPGAFHGGLFGGGGSGGGGLPYGHPRLLPRRVSYGSLDDVYHRFGLPDHHHHHHHHLSDYEYDLASDIFDDNDDDLFDSPFAHLRPRSKSFTFLPRSNSFAYYTMSPRG